ncbi:MAG: phosphoenolpyruvate carboxykinase [Acidobacteria bacterium]|nr:MAG: phosphoenolpyruvate carboxykinase [Acidobacteriota bacterium]
MSQGDRKVGLGAVGITRTAGEHWNLSAAALYEEALRAGEGQLSKDGALVCSTGKYTGRSPNDKFVVKEASSEKNIDWGKVNKPFDSAKFDALHKRMTAYAAGKNLFVLDGYAGADPAYRLPVRIITEMAWHSLFVRNMFIPVTDPAEQLAHQPEFTVIDIPSFKADPAIDGTNSETFILLSFDRKLVLIGGTQYAGEMKKGIFTVMNYLLPLRDTMPMHCSANVGTAGDVALFFGLSGTGKTTLSSDTHRGLIGDDEHGWSADGVFNFEGGCYAKTIKLSAEAEPQIYATTKRFGTVLENVVMDPITRVVDFDDASKTENTRCSYPLSYIENSVPSGRAGHPANVVMLTADAFGVLPPIARLSPDAAQYHFLSGYTAKVAGTERGVTEPTPIFSTCFGAPFMVWDPNVYAKLLGDRIAKHQARVWLVNTGWTGGPYGVGSRMKIAYTRAMINAALSGQLDKVAYERDPIFNLDVPTSCPGVPADVLMPKNTWKDKAAYDAQARKLAAMFIENFKRFEATAKPEVKAAGPKA